MKEKNWKIIRKNVLKAWLEDEKFERRKTE